MGPGRTVVARVRRLGSEEHVEHRERVRPSRTLAAAFRRVEAEHHAEHRERARLSRRHAQGYARRHVGQPSMLSQRRGASHRGCGALVAGGIFRSVWWAAPVATRWSALLATPSVAGGRGGVISWRGIGCVGAWAPGPDPGEPTRRAKQITAKL